MSNKDFSDRLKKVGKSFPGGLRAWAHAAGIPESTIFSYSSGILKNPGIDKASRLARTAGVSLDWLATGKGTMWTKDLSFLPENALNIQRLQDSIESIEQYCRQRRIDLDSKEKAQVVALIYDAFSQFEHLSVRRERDGEHLSAQELRRLIRCLSEPKESIG